MKSYLDFIKERLKITWDYQDDELNLMIENAKAYIKSFATFEFTLENPTNAQRMANELLADYCRFLWSGYGNSFAQSYKSQIISLQIQVAMEKK